MTDFRSYEMTKAERILFWIGMVLLALFLSLILYKNVLFAAVLIPFMPKLRSFYIRWRIEQRRNTYLLEFKDFLFLASTSIGAGRSLKDAMGESVPGIREIYGSRSLLAREIENCYERMEIGNEEDSEVLMELAVYSGIEDVVDFAAIYKACRTTGASLILAMNRAAAMIIDKMTIEKEIRELTRRKESEGMMIFAMPVLVLVFLNLSSPDYIAPLYQTLAGRVIMTAVIAANIGIYEMIQKIVKVAL